MLLVAAIVLVLLVPEPATAHGGSRGIGDVDTIGPGRTLPGHDFDPACEERRTNYDVGYWTYPIYPPPLFEIYPYADVDPAYYCEESSNDGSSKSTDLSYVGLASNAGYDTIWGSADDRLVATIDVNGIVPMPGDPRTAFDGPRDTSPERWTGATYFVLFNNYDKQIDRPNPLAGCIQHSGVAKFDQQRHWSDGYYKFLAISSAWTGTDWVVTPSVGTYDPTPSGGFQFTDLANEAGMRGPDGVSGSGDDEFGYSVTRYGSPGRTRLQLWVEGNVEHADPTCTSGVFTETFANHAPGPFSYSYAGDRIGNVFGLTTADLTVGLPVTVPTGTICREWLEFLVPCGNDIKVVARFLDYADNTHQWAGGDVYTPGIFDRVDNLGDGIQCPTPTFGGALPENPVAAQDVACQIDDDGLGNLALAEFHKSGYDFIY